MWEEKIRTLVPCTFKEVLRMLQDCYGESILLPWSENLPKDCYRVVKVQK